MPAEIRTAEMSDLVALVAMENAVFDADRISRKGFRGMMSGRSATLLVAQGGRTITGYCAILFRAGSRKARLYSLAATHSGRGVGAGLLSAAEAAAADRGCVALRLEVRADNARAIGLYQRSGYRLFGQTAGYYADGATALRFEKLLVHSPGESNGGGGTVTP